MALARGLVRPLRRNLVRGLVLAADTVSAASLLAQYPAGMAMDYYSNTVSVKDPVTAANNKTDIPVASWATVTRASTGWYFDSAGLLKSAGNNVPRLVHHDPISRVAQGMAWETSRTNLELHSADLTQAVWIKTDVDVAKNQVGIDGTANSATLITATADNGTVSQAMTVASSARTQSAYVKRVSGTGPLHLSQDNGSTFVDITPPADGSLYIGEVSATLANPTTVLRIGTSGDSFIVLHMQNENGADKTTPIPTAGASVTRAVDLLTVPLSAFPFDATKGTIYVEGVSTGLNNTQRTFFQIDDGSNNNRYLGCLSTLGGGQFLVVSGNVNQANVLPGVAVPGILQRMMTRWDTTAPGSAQAALDGVLGTQDNTVTVPVSPTTLRVGGGLSATGPFQGAIGRIIYVPQALS